MCVDNRQSFLCLLTHHQVFFAHSKVSNLNVTIGVQHDVVELQVSVQNALAVKKVQREHNLPSIESCPVFRHTTALLDLEEQVTARHHFHHVVETVRCLKARMPFLRGDGDGDLSRTVKKLHSNRYTCVGVGVGISLFFAHSASLSLSLCTSLALVRCASLFLARGASLSLSLAVRLPPSPSPSRGASPPLSLSCFEETAIGTIGWCHLTHIAVRYGCLHVFVSTFFSVSAHSKSLSSISTSFFNTLIA